MKIESKFVYVKHKEDFEPLISTIPDKLNPIVFIEDTREIWTCGTYFNVGYPSLNVSEKGGSILISLGDSDLTLITSGESLSLRKGEGNSVILSSNALTRINTQVPLEWANNILIHKTSGVNPGSYGPTSNMSDASTLQIPNITINDTGHITSAETRNIQIRDYVYQLSPSELSVTRNILLSYNEANNQDDTAQVRKANGLTFNDATGILAVSGGINASGPVNVTKGDLTVTDGYIVGKVKGDVEGQAVPKVHLSTKPEYGGASTKMYGHVLVQDELPISAPDPSSDNIDAGNTGVNAIAASPLMVWNAIVKMKDYIDAGEGGINISAIDENGEEKNISKGFSFSNDFSVDNNNNIYITWAEV